VEKHGEESWGQSLTGQLHLLWHKFALCCGLPSGDVVISPIFIAIPIPIIIIIIIIIPPASLSHLAGVLLFSRQIVLCFGLSGNLWPTENQIERDEGDQKTPLLKSKSA